MVVKKTLSVGFRRLLRRYGIWGFALNASIGEPKQRLHTRIPRRLDVGVCQDWHNILTGSCRMGRDKFCKENGIDLTKKYGVEYFLNITKNSYGGDIIKEIIKELTKGKNETI